jgi:hypothetical protein
MLGRESLEKKMPHGYPTVTELFRINDSGHVRLQPVRILVAVGGKQPGFRAAADAATTQVVTETEGNGPLQRHRGAA